MLSRIGPWARRACLAALILPPLPAPAEVAVQFDAAIGHMIVSGLEPDAITRVLAEPDRLRLQLAGSASARGMLVSLSRTTVEIVVVPRFPLRPGSRYVLALDLPEGDVSAAFALPAPEAPAPRLAGFAPSQGVIPANVLRLYLSFSEPMARGQVRHAVTLLRADGTSVPSPFLSLDSELWDASQTRVTLLFDPGRIKQGVGPNAAAGAPLEPGEAYRLLISGAMESAEGTPLGKDVALAFRVGPPERTVVAPQNWQILLPTANSYETLTVVFDRIMDSGAIPRLLILHDETGARVPGQVTTDGRGWLLTPHRPWQAGRYHLVVDPALEDVSGNMIRAPLDAGIGTIGTPQAPVTLTLEIAAP
jgi:hypothetical protein